jgi:hypothetical protein
MSWWRNKRKEQEGLAAQALRLVAEEQRINRTLVQVVEEQSQVISRLLEERARHYPATTGIQVIPQ